MDLCTVKAIYLTQHITGNRNQPDDDDDDDDFTSPRI